MIGSCDHCRELLWDLAYDLLPVDQTNAVRAHVQGCPACLQALKDVEAKQQRIAAAARLAIEVPRFTRPAETPTVLPFPAPVGRRTVARLAALAAVLLVAIGLPWGLYEQGQRQRADAFAAANARLLEAARVRATFHQVAQAEHDEFLRDAKGKHLRMQVVGPTVYQPHVPSAHQVQVTDLSGRPADVEVTTRILAADQRELLRTTQRTTGGTLVVSLPAGLAAEGQPLSLDLTAVGTHARVQLRDTLPVQADYVTHLAVAKPLYQPGDIVFFRSVTLDRFALTPARASLEMRYTLTDPTGRVLHEATGVLAEGGICGGSIELPRKGLKEGEYLLTAAEAQGRFASQSRRLHVYTDRPVRLKKVIEFDRAAYEPGDTVEVTLAAQRLKEGTPVEGGLVTANLKIDGEPDGPGVRGKTDAAGKARLKVRLPAKLGRSVQLTFVVRDGAFSEAVERTIPVGKPGLVVEFFPEGGDLVAGVPNRVYVRARTTLGAGAAVTGTILDSRGQELATVQTSAADAAGPGGVSGLGVCVFTPRPNQSYSFQIAGSEVPLPLPPVRNDGIVLHAPSAALESAQPIPVVLRGAGAPRDLVLAAFCRGRLVAQEVVRSFSGEKELRLTPPATLGGVFRVTVFADNGELRPIAERLVYRTPGDRLNLTADTGTRPAVAGEKVKLSLGATRANGQPTPAWVLVTVVDQEPAGLTGRKAGPSLPAQYHLLSELRRPEDLEDADFLLSGGPVAKAHLDLYLGTQGWRRLVDPNLAETPPATDSRVAALVKLDSVAASWQQLGTELQPALIARSMKSQADDRPLLNEQLQSYGDAVTAFRAQDTFQEETRGLLRVGLIAGVIGLVLLGVLVLLPVGMENWQALSKVAQPYLASGTAALLLGCGVLWGVLQVRDGRDPDADVVWGTLPRETFQLSLPEEALVAMQTPARRAGILTPVVQTTGEAEGANLVQLDRLVEQRSLVNGTADKPIRGVAPGDKFTATAASVGVVKPEKPLPKTPPVRVPSAEAVAREYAYLADKPATEFPDTVLWYPGLSLTDGRADLELVLPRRGATYQILLHGHTNSGQLGFQRLDWKTAP